MLTCSTEFLRMGKKSGEHGPDNKASSFESVLHSNSHSSPSVLLSTSYGFVSVTKLVSLHMETTE